MATISLWTVFIYATITAVATGLGALPLYIARVNERWLGAANAAAAGLMLAASFNLIYEGINYSLFRVVLGILLGLVFIMLNSTWLRKRGAPGIGDLKGAGALRALMIVGIMTLHSFAEGIGVGVSFGGGEKFGAFISIAIAVHNIPEGVAISLVLVPQGVKVWKAALWSIFTSLPQPIMAIPSFLFVEAFTPFLPFGFGLAAGAMLWMVFAEIVPESAHEISPSAAAAIVTISIAAMVAFQVMIDI